MLILAIETSCDETSLALIETNGGLRAPAFKVIKNLIASQIETHRPWGGVVPNLAKREHLQNLPILFGKLKAKSYKLKANVIAVTVGPGLEPCLWTGINFAKEIQKQHLPKAKLVGVNHLHGHMYSFILAQKKMPNVKTQMSKLFPAVQLIVSGGHTVLLLMNSLTKWQKLGETRDDAAGECFDKVARMLGLPYPGGPEIEKLALKAKSHQLKAINFPRPMINSKNYDFSFSGLKTAVLYYIRQHKLEFAKTDLEMLRTATLGAPPSLVHEPEGRGVGGARGSGGSPLERADRGAGRSISKSEIAASFQKAVVETLVSKTLRAAREYNAKSIILSGGVAANKALRNTLRTESKKIGAKFISAPIRYHGDNAAMIGVAGYITRLRKKTYPPQANGTLGV